MPREPTFSQCSLPLYGLSPFSSSLTKGSANPFLKGQRVSILGIVATVSLLRLPGYRAKAATDHLYVEKWDCVPRNFIY